MLDLRMRNHLSTSRKADRRMVRLTREKMRSFEPYAEQTGRSFQSRFERSTKLRLGILCKFHHAGRSAGKMGGPHHTTLSIKTMAEMLDPG